MTGKVKKFIKKKKVLYIGWDELDPMIPRMKKDESNLSITNENVCFMVDNEQVTLNDYITSEEIEDAYIELVGDFKKLSKRFTTLKNKQHLVHMFMKIF